MPNKALMCRLAIASVLALSSSLAHAAVDEEGRGETPYSLGVFQSKPDPAVRQKAIEVAEHAAIQRYASGFTTAKAALFQSVAPQIYNSIGQYIIDESVVDEGVNADSKTYYVVIRTSIDDTKISAILNQQGSANSAGSAGASAKPISFLFVERQEDSATSFDVRRTSVATNQNANAGSQAQALSGGSASYSATGQSTTVATTGGSEMRQADKVTYQVTSPEDLNTAMSNVLTSDGFQVYNYQDVASQCPGADTSTIYAEYAKSETLSPATRSGALRAAKQCQIGLFAMGTMDIGLPDADPVTGNLRVFVTVRSQLLDISGMLPRTIASVGPAQYQGLGPDASVAQTNALNLAAAAVANGIADQLNAKGIH